MWKLTVFYTSFLLFFSINLFAQKVTVHGTISDAENGEALIGATIIDKETGTGVVTNNYGFYSLTLPKGKTTLLFSYVGYKTIEKPFDLTEDKHLNLELEVDNEMIEEVVITSEAKNQNVTSTKISVQKMDARQIEKVPVMFGEADVIKAIKLLPGVATTSETSSNISVRGGAFDQNLILLDEATVYSASHMGGIFSVFNNDAVNSVEFYKGSFPAQYGGRLSSVMDVRMKEGSTKNFSAKGAVGLMSSKLTLEVPVIDDKLGVLISGRRTYFDLLGKLANTMTDKEVGFPYYFYDLNAKVNYKVNENNRIYLSGYFGRDVVNMSINDNSDYVFEWGNYTGTLRWNSILTKRLFMNVSFVTSKYDFLIDSKDYIGEDRDEYSFTWKSFMKDYSGKIDFGYFLNTNNTLKFGVMCTYHDFSTGEVESIEDTTQYNFSIPKFYAVEGAAYISNKQKISDGFNAEYGLRFGYINNIGPGIKNTIEKTGDDYEVVSKDTIAKYESYNYDYAIEPRVALTYAFNDKNSVKLGYAYAKQFIMVASNSFAGTPIDVYIPVTNNIDPQYAHQVSCGYFRNFFDNALETSLELYYKPMYNQVEFRPFSTPYLNEDMEEDFRFGKATSYGAEVYISKPKGKLNGWISYTYSHTMKKIEDYWDDDWYPSAYDMPHNFAIVANYDLSRLLEVSANWVYQSGKPFDAPVARGEYEGVILPVYPDEKNQSRLPAYHRLDLSVNLWIFPMMENAIMHLNLSVYNVYNRSNANTVFFQPDDDDPYTTRAYKYSLFSRFPTLAILFEF